MGNRVLRGVLGSAFAAGFLILLPTASMAHSGGTDRNGCHAGSQPYHCHGGSGGGGGGGGAVPFVDPGPSAAERAELASAKQELAEAEAAYAQSKPLVSKLERDLKSVQATWNKQRDDIAGRQAEIDRERAVATKLRSLHIAEREDANQRIGLIRSANLAERDEYVSTRLGIAYLAALLGTFLVFGLVKTIAAAILGAWRIAALVTGVVSSIALFGLALGTGSFGFGILPAILGGALFSVVLMLSRVWWLAIGVPKTFSLVAVSLAAILAVGALAAAATLAAPVAEVPAQADQSLAEESKSDPEAEELEPARTIDADADKMQAEIDELTKELDAVGATLENLTSRTADARTKVEEHKTAIASAKESLDDLE